MAGQIKRSKYEDLRLVCSTMVNKKELNGVVHMYNPSSGDTRTGLGHQTSPMSQ